MNVLIACEFSGIVRDAFAVKGHNAWSCDLLPTEKPGQHYQGNVRDIIYERHPILESCTAINWDLIIAHPPCTHLSVSGARWFKDKIHEQNLAISFFMSLYDAPASKICVENPVSIMSTRFRKPDQIIQPWQFGHGETKSTCLWLKGLPKLNPTEIVQGREGKVWKMPPSKDRWKDRSRTYQGIANAMAEQWG